MHIQIDNPRLGVHYVYCLIGCQSYLIFRIIQCSLTTSLFGLLTGKPIISSNTLDKLWGTGKFSVYLWTWSRSIFAHGSDWDEIDTMKYTQGSDEIILDSSSVYFKPFRKFIFGLVRYSRSNILRIKSTSERSGWVSFD